MQVGQAGWQAGRQQITLSLAAAIYVMCPLPRAGPGLATLHAIPMPVLLPGWMYLVVVVIPHRTAARLAVVDVAGRYCMPAMAVVDVAGWYCMPAMAVVVFPYRYCMLGWLVRHT